MDPISIPSLCLSFLIISLSSAAFMRNAYKVSMENMEICPDNDKMESPLYNLKYGNINRTHKALSYDFTLKRSLDSNVGIAIKAERWAEGKWVGVPFLSFQGDICNFYLRYFPDVWVKLNANMGVKRPDKCPVPAGDYHLKNFVVDASTIKIPFFSGRFRFICTVQTVDTKKNLYCSITTMRIDEIF